MKTSSSAAERRMTETGDDDETTSDVWLFEPLTGEKHRRVDTFEGNECREPE